MIWIEPYATRLPGLADLRRFIRRSEEIDANSLTPDWLTLVRPDSLPIEPLPGSGYLNGKLWRSAIMEAVDFARQTDCVVVIGKPSLLAIKLMKAMSGCRLIYDAMDDFPAFYNGLSRNTMKRTEEKIASLADVIWASSTILYDRWNNNYKRVRLLHNGLDFEVVTAVHLKDASSDRAVFGYLGTIGNWFDWDLIMALATIIPNDKVQIHGPVYKYPSVKLPANIEMYPPTEHADAMSFMTGFDIGLIPFIKNELTRSVDPIKYYEYRAFKIPVLSSDFGEMRHRGQNDGVYLVRDIADLEKVVAEARKAIRARQLDQIFAFENSWTVRFDQIVQDF